MDIDKIIEKLKKYFSLEKRELEKKNEKILLIIEKLKEKKKHLKNQISKTPKKEEFYLKEINAINKLIAKAQNLIFE